MGTCTYCRFHQGPDRDEPLGKRPLSVEAVLRFDGSIVLLSKRKLSRGRVQDHENKSSGSWCGSGSAAPLRLPYWGPDPGSWRPYSNNMILKHRRTGKRVKSLAGPSPLFLLIYSDEAETVMYA